MKTLYIECSMGAAGDMLNAALFDLLEPQQQAEYLAKMNSIAPGVIEVRAEHAQKCGIAGTHIAVYANGCEEHVEDVGLSEANAAKAEKTAQHEAECAHQHEHHAAASAEHGHTPHHADGHERGHHVHAAESPDHEHASHAHDHAHRHGVHLGDIASIIEAADAPAQARADALAVYSSIAQAEAHAHGKPVSQVHFHEVGTLDAVADVVGFCLLMNMVAPQKVVCSPIHVGTGSVRCAHGIVPVPAPATAYLLQGAPTFGGNIQGELCTPTGAALIRHFAQEFGPMPAMSVRKTGVGCGTKDFPAANIVRAFLGDSAEVANADNTPADNGALPKTNAAETDSPQLTDQIVELACNIDDMTAEEIAFATQALIDAGAADVFTTPIGMKKNRPATMITCLCKPADKKRFVELMFKHTTTLGVRERLCNRYILARSEGAQETALGRVGYKESHGFGSFTRKYDYDDLARIAHENNLSLREVKSALNATIQQLTEPTGKATDNG